MAFKKGHKINLGRYPSKETRKKIGLKSIGRKNPKHSKFMKDYLKIHINPAKLPGVGEKISKANTGKKRPEQSKFMKENNPMKNPDIAKKHAEMLRGRKALKTTGDLNPSKRPEVKRKQREARIKQILEIGGGPNIGKHEKQILDFIEPSIGFPIIRQYIVNGYFVDGYCPERNIVFEVDERLKNTKRDIQRQKEIESKLNCKFIRIKDY